MEERKVYELDLHGKGLKVLPEDLKKVSSMYRRLCIGELNVSYHIAAAEITQTTGCFLQ